MIEGGGGRFTVVQKKVQPLFDAMILFQKKTIPPQYRRYFWWQRKEKLLWPLLLKLVIALTILWLVKKVAQSTGTEVIKLNSQGNVNKFSRHD